MRQTRIQNVESVRVFARLIRQAIAQYDEGHLRIALEEEAAITVVFRFDGGERVGAGS